MRKSKMGQVIDKGRIVAAVDKYQDKENGQPMFNQDNTPKMKNKWMAIGEVTKWSNDDGSESVTTKIYLQPVNTSGNFFEQKTFWDSENTNTAGQPSQQYAPQQQQAPQQYQQAPNHSNHR